MQQRASRRRGDSSLHNLFNINSLLFVMEVEKAQQVKPSEVNFDEDDDDFEEFDVEDWEKEKNQEQIGIKQW